MTDDMIKEFNRMSEDLIGTPIHPNMPLILKSRIMNFLKNWGYNDGANFDVKIDYIEKEFTVVPNNIYTKEIFKRLSGKEKLKYADIN